MDTQESQLPDKVPAGAIEQEGFYALDGKIYNGQGAIAMKYKHAQQPRITCGGILYLFIIQANIPMAWIDPAHVACALAKRGGCCGQSVPGVISYANLSDARQWTNRGGR